MRTPQSFSGRCLAAAVVLLAAVSLGPVPVRAQGLQTGILGVTHDTSGAVLPGVTITITNRGTGVVRTDVTDAAGAFNAAGLQAGTYDVSAELSGFKTAVRTAIPLESGNTVRVDLTMEVGAVGETVEVMARADTRLMRTEDASLGAVLNESQVQGLPVKDRNFMALAQLVPGATEALVGNQNTLGRSQPLNLSVLGQRMFDNNIRLDGVSIINGFSNGSTFIPSLESLKEVTVQTGQYGAAYGMFSGAQVDMIVKSGQNELRGSAFEYHRDDGLQARGYFDVGDTPPFTQNQFGATLGGPLVRNRTFFFVGYEGTRADRETTGQTTVATDAMRAGDFSALSTVIRDPYTGQAFPGNVIPAGRIAPQALRLLEYIPHANQAGAANNYIGTSTTDSTENQFFLRIDHQLSAGATLFGRLASRTADIDTVNLNPSFRAFAQPENQDYVVGYTKVMSPRWLLDARASFVRESSPNQTGREGADIDPLRDFGIGGLSTSDPLLRGIPNASISGYAGTGETFANPRLLYQNPEFKLDSNYDLGGHGLQFGVDVFRRRMDFYSVNASNQGSFTFSGLLTGNAFADFLLGLPDTTTYIPNLAKTSLRQKHVQAYVQDNWTARPNLTVNAGLRYEYAGAVSDALGIARNLDLATMELFPAPGVAGDLTNDHHDFAPRLSATYRVSDSTVLRGGYGIYYTQPTMANVALMFRNPPYNSQFTYNTVRTNPNLTLANGFPGSGGTGVSATATITTVPVDYGPGYAQTWSANLQQRLGGGWVAEAGYVGSTTTGLDNAWTLNTPPPGPGAVQARRPNPNFGDIRVFGTDGEAEYNGIQLRAQNLDFHGMNILSTYSYSRCYDTRSSPATSTVGSEDQEPQNQNDRFDGEWGRCAIDFRSVFKLNVVYEIPVGESLAPALRAIVGGWQAGIGVNLHSGGPFNVIVSGNPANTSRGTIRPNMSGDPNLPAGDRTLQRWFDTSAFSAPAAFTFGNAPRNAVEGPGTKLVDLNLQKRIRAGGTRTLELRVDVFNLFNTPQFGTPGRTLGTPAFGVISSAGPGRQVQLGTRFVF
jgi:outer membrane receptor protein involved in Fe transport